MLVIPVVWVVDIRRITVQGHPGQKVSKTPSQLIKLGMVLCTCLASYIGDLNKGLKSKLAQVKTAKLDLKKYLKQKGLGVWLKW
jgi:hypothetical protein